MNKILYIILISLIVSNCTFKPVIKHHGVSFLEKKQASLIVNKSNKNDIIKLLGNPSTKSKFDNDIWIYIERKHTQSDIKKFGKVKIHKNDVLVLEIDTYGILKNKNFYNKEDINDIKFAEGKTDNELKRNSFIYSFMSSIRQKINDPLGQRAKKRSRSN